MGTFRKGQHEQLSVRLSQDHPETHKHQQHSKAHIDLIMTAGGYVTSVLCMYTAFTAF